MKVVLLLDADNTIWDTDSLFAAAQVALLGKLRQQQFALNPEADLLTLRAIDRKLSERLCTSEYNFELLASALIAHSRGLALSQAVDSAIEGRAVALEADREAVSIAVTAFHRVLSRPAKLLPGMPDVLAFLRQQTQRRTRELSAIIVSEGRPERVLKTIRYHRLNDDSQYFDSILLGQKGVRLFAKAQLEGAKVLQTRNPRMVVVGDSIQGDIKPGNMIGAITVYKPSGFLGEEVPSIPEERPSYRIGNPKELLPILRSIIGRGKECPRRRG